MKNSILSLKQDGYLIAIDDYEGDREKDPLVALADIIKIDVLGRGREEIKAILDKLVNSKAIRLAEKVDNHETHTMCKELGFDLFQGFFYAMPHNIPGKKLPAFVSVKTELMKLLSKEDCDIDLIVEKLKIDPSIGYRLLRYINSPAFGFSSEIDTIKRASDMLGAKRLSRWLQLVIMSDLTPKKKTVELYRKSLERAKYFENVCDKGNGDLKPDSCFTFGLLSLLDALFDMQMNEILDQLPLGSSLKKGYQDESSLLNKHLKIIQAIEQGDDDRLNSLCTQFNLSRKKSSKDSQRQHCGRKKPLPSSRHNKKNATTSKN